jgi:hypothetical protein
MLAVAALGADRRVGRASKRRALASDGDTAASAFDADELNRQVLQTVAHVAVFTAAATAALIVIVIAIAIAFGYAWMRAQSRVRMLAALPSPMARTQVLDRATTIDAGSGVATAELIDDGTAPTILKNEGTHTPAHTPAYTVTEP